MRRNRVNLSHKTSIHTYFLGYIFIEFTFCGWTAFYCYIVFIVFIVFNPLLWHQWQELRFFTYGRCIKEICIAIIEQTSAKIVHGIIKSKVHSCCKPCLHKKPCFHKRAADVSSGLALANLERFGEDDLVFINWRSCRHCLQNEWPLNFKFLCWKLSISSSLPNQFLLNQCCAPSMVQFSNVHTLWKKGLNVSNVKLLPFFFCHFFVIFWCFFVFDL